MTKARSIPRRLPIRRTRPKLVHQCLIVLTGIDPLVWRRIQVPEAYSFWDLHVAIQDAMGWLDYHLHEFRLLDAEEKRIVSIGIPTDDDPEDRPMIPGWELPLSRFFARRGWHAPPASYAYDFGDDWEHVLVHRSLLLIEGPTPTAAPDVHPHSIEGALVSIAAMWRLPVLHTCDPEQSVRLLRFLADPWQSHPECFGKAGGREVRESFAPP